jgi:hypothetical protein
MIASLCDLPLRCRGNRRGNAGVRVIIPSLAAQDRRPHTGRTRPRNDNE